MEEQFIELLRSTKREGIENLIDFFKFAVLVDYAYKSL